MAILTHGSDLTLAPTIGPLLPSGGGTVRGALDKLSAAEFHSVQLSAAIPGIRPRDLDKRARRDLIAMLTRQSFRLAGLDLFIPRAHFLDTAQVDRAAGAVVAAIELAADLGRVPLSVALPMVGLSDDVKHALVQAADGHGVCLAVHAEDQSKELLDWLAAVDLPALGAAIDPAVMLAAGADPVALAQRLGPRLRVARLSDAVSGSDLASETGSSRCVLGKGELDVIPYRVALDLAQGRLGPVVLELRGLPQPISAAAEANRQWSNAAFTA